MYRLIVLELNSGFRFDSDLLVWLDGLLKIVIVVMLFVYVVGSGLLKLMLFNGIVMILIMVVFCE